MYKHCPLITAVSGFALLVFGVICSWYIFPTLVANGIAESTALKEGTFAYKAWLKQPFPLQFKVYLFNVTNPEEVQFGGNPIVKEVGPYVFDEYRERLNVKVHEERDTLEYYLRKTFFFNEKESGCRSNSDVLTILNAAIIGTALQVESMLPSALPTVSQAIPYLYPGTTDIFMRATVQDVLFGGITIHCTHEEVEFLCGAMKGSLPSTIKQAPNGKDFVFSMFGHLNNTDVGPWEMARGFKNTTRGDVYSFHGKTAMDKWATDECNMINGSDSTVFPFLPMPRPKRIYSFADDFCRSLYVTYMGEGTEFDIPVAKYATTEDTLADIPQNECFCPTGQDEAGNDVPKCPPSGMMNLLACLKADILISYPHFYLADKKLHDYVTGLSPNKSLHENYASVEPRTATPLAGRKRIQMNLRIKRMENFDLLANVTDGIFPLLWLEEGVTLPEEVIQMLKVNFSRIDLLGYIKWGLIFVGIAVMATSFVLVTYRERLMCFANNGTVPITNGNVNPLRVDDGFDVGDPMNGVRHGMVDGHPMEVMDVNMSYPALYPQMDGKNTHDGMVRRNGSKVQQWNSNAWQK